MSKPTTDARQTYDAAARSYDELTQDYRHESWTAALLAKAEEWGLQGNRLLDAGCGTGKSFIPMLERGWQVTGCDISAGMVEVAREKVGDRAELLVADLRELGALGSFDLVWAVNDTLNYMLAEEELIAALTNLRANLTPGGLLVFDLNPFAIYRDYFTEGTEVERGGPRRPVWRGLTSRATAIPGAVFDAEIDTHDPPESQHHRQRHYSRAEAIAALQEAGFACLDVSGELDGELQPGLDEAVHTKAVYVARSA